MTSTSDSDCSLARKQALQFALVSNLLLLSYTQAVTVCAASLHGAIKQFLN